MNKTLSRLETQAVEKNIKLTKHQKAVASVLSQSNNHPSIDEIYQLTVKLGYKLSLTTVYRAIKIFEENGLVEKLDLGSATPRYELTPLEHHDHLIDISSGKVIEFNNDKIEKLQIEIAKELGYELISHKLELFGTPINKKKY